MERTTRFFLYGVCCALIGYYVWSFFVSSRYQALCNIAYWSATKEQIEACRNRKSELDDRK
ncbi:MAG TPA: hypothetical protein VEH76_13630 [Methylocystis sp.]|nr:hypothetical protein [Methylocystis sp.]